jgi:hypothetical protein
VIERKEKKIRGDKREAVELQQPAENLLLCGRVQRPCSSCPPPPPHVAATLLSPVNCDIFGRHLHNYQFLQV